MKSIFKNLAVSLALLIILISSNAFSQDDLKERILSLTSIVSVKNIEPGSDFKEAFEIFIEQPVDHNDPAGDKFKQKL